jgi:Fis family transcriptional regulator
MQELAQHKSSLEHLASGDTNNSDSLLSSNSPDLAERGIALASSTLRGCVEQTLHNYFAHLDGQAVTNIYEMVLSEVEAPLLEVVMRKKLQQYGLL